MKVIQKLVPGAAILLFATWQASAAPVLNSYTYFGTSSGERCAAVSVSSGALFFAGSSDILGNEGLVGRFDLPLTTGAAPAWNINWPNQANSDTFYGVAASGGSVFVAGDSYSQTTDSVGGKENKGIVVKYPWGGGTPLWQRQTPAAPGAFTYGGSESLNSAAVASEGGSTYVYVTGNAQSGFSNGGRMFLSKVREDSTVIWTVTDSVDTPYTSGRAVLVMAGNIYLSTYDSGVAASAVLKKYSPSGALLWTRSSTNSSIFNAMTATSDGRIVVVGSAGGTSGSGTDFTVEEWDESGARMWARRYDRSASEDTLKGVTVLNGRIYAAGLTRGATAGGTDVALLEFDATNGDLLSTTLYGGPLDDIGNSIATDGTDLYVGGETLSYGAGGSDVLVLRYSVGQAPVITMQPHDATNAPGSSVTFTISATGSIPLWYQWRKDGVAIPNTTGKYTGMISDMLTINNVEFSDAGSYDCVVSNSFGTTVSFPATLTVQATGTSQTAIFREGAPDPFTGANYAGVDDVVILHNGLYSPPFGYSGSDNFGVRQDFGVGNAVVNGSDGPRRSLIRFNITSMAGHYNTIQSAKLRLYVSGVPSGIGTIQLFRVAALNGDWVEGSGCCATGYGPEDGGGSTFNYKVQASYPSEFAGQPWAGGAYNGCGVPGTDYLTPALANRAFDTSLADGSVFEFLITDVAMIQDWINGNNSGLFLRASAETGVNIITFHSSDRPDLNVRPELEIQYDSTQTNLPPTVAITSPADGTVFNAPATLTLYADASDDTGLSSVIFYEGTNFVGDATMPPYSVTASGLPAGEYVFTAVAMDNGGISSTSAPVHVTVQMDSDGDGVPDGTDNCPFIYNPDQTLYTLYRDADNDGYGNPLIVSNFCSIPPGYVSNNTDCDDSNSSTHPGAAEVLDNVDNDCDGNIDEDIAPVIVAQPSSQNVYSGDTFSLYVSASGSQPLAYQWKKDGVDLIDGGNVSGATSSSLIVFSASTNDAGIYTLDVTNAFGSTTSSPATVTVTVLGAVLRTNDIVVIDTDPNVTSGAQGKVWRIDPLTGEQTLIAIGLRQPEDVAIDKFGKIVFVDGWDSMLYRIEPANGARTALSAGVSSNPRGVAVEPAGPIVVVSENGGGTGELFRIDPTNGFSTLVSSGGNLQFPIGVAIEPGGNSVVIDSPTHSVVRIDRITGAQTIVSAGGLFTGPPTGIAVEADGTIVVTVVSTPSGPAVVRIDPATGAQTVVSSGGMLSQPVAIAIDSAGDFIVADNWNKVMKVDRSTGAQSIVSQYGGLRSLRGVTIFRPQPAAIPPSITLQPSNSVNPAGTTATFSVTANGTTPLSYQWKKDGVELADGGNISGATTPMLTIGNVATADAAGYSVLVSNSAGSVLSSNATLTVTPAVLVSIAVTPTNSTLMVGQTQQFTATGTFSDGTSRTLTNGSAGWTNKAPIPTASYGLGGAFVNGKFYAISGFATTRVAVYSPTNNFWTTVPSLPNQMLQYFGTAVLDGKIYVVGGDTGGGGDRNTLYVFDPANNSWTQKASMPLGSRYGLAAAALNGKIYALGGYSIGAGTYLNRVEIYDPVSNTWTNGVPMPTQHFGALAGVIDGKLYVAGGGTQSGPTTALHVFDPASNTWSTNASSPFTVNNGAVLEGKLFAIGASSSENKVLAYDPMTDNWLTNFPSMPTPRHDCGIAADASNRRIYVVGGWNGGYVSALQVFSLNAGEVWWSSSAPTVAPIYGNGVATGASDGSTIITATAGSVSGSALLNVLTPLSIVTQPQSVTKRAGETATFSVVASGSAPLSYQWKKESADIAGATDSTLTLSNVSESDSGSYTVLVSNSTGSILSSNATLTVDSPPVLTVPSVPLAVSEGSPLSFSVSATDDGGTAPALSASGLPAGAVFTPNGDGTGTFSWTPGYSAAASSPYVVSFYANDGNNLAVSANVTIEVQDVNRVPVFTSVPSAITTGAGAPLSFSVTAVDPDATTPSLAATNLPSGATFVDNVNGTGGFSWTPTLSQVGSFTVTFVATDGAASATATTAITVTNTAVAPEITANPQSRTNNAGTAATFSVSASGTAPLAYRWQKNGADLSDGSNVSGAATATLTLSNVSLSDVADYTVVVSNSAGSVSSLPATLTVVVPPGITSQPLSRTNGVGTSATFSVVATGNFLNYQWRKNGADLSNGGAISGATTAALTIGSVSATDAGTYTVVVSNAAGAATSSNAVLTVIAAPVITLQPQSRTNIAGTSVSFTVAATGAAPLSYQWKKDGEPISGATTTVLNLSSVTQANAADYSVDVTNSGGTTSSAVAHLTVIDRVAIVSQPSHTTNNIGTTATFTVVASGTSPSYQWKKGTVVLSNGGNISGAQSATLSISSLTTADAGSYSVIVSNLANSVNSSVATLKVVSPPLITLQPVEQRVPLGSNAVFRVRTSGTGTMTYQWRKGTTPLAASTHFVGVTSSNLTVVASTMADEGDYNVVVSSAIDSITSSNAALVIVPDVKIVSPLASAIIETNVITVTGTASDSRGISQVWFRVGNGAFTLATGTTSWSAQVPLSPGTNIFAVKAVSGTGVESSPVTRSYFMRVFTTFHLTVNGVGTVSGNITDGQLALVGKGYKLIAYPGVGQLFSNWSGTISNNNRYLDFIMTSNMTLQANFVANPFLPIYGKYTGLFYEPDDIKFQSAGSFNLTLQSSGAASGAVVLQGTPRKLTGRFSLDGLGTFNVSDASGLPVSVVLQLDLTNNTQKILGTVTGTTWSSPLVANRSVYSLTNPAPQVGTYTLSLLGSTDGSTSPGGDAIGKVSVSSVGMVRVAGKLPDNKSFSRAIPVSKNGEWPLFVPSLTGAFLLGWEKFTNEPNNSLDGTVTWYAPGTIPAYGTFTNQMQLIGSTLGSLATRVLAITNGVAIISDGDFIGRPLTNNIAYSEFNVVTGNNSLTLYMSPLSGFFRGTFIDPVSHLRYPILGVPLQQQNRIHGFVIGTNKIGYFLLQGN